jgi:hypothetical protein
MDNKDKTIKITFVGVVLVFILGVTTGVVTTRLTGAAIEPVSSVDQRETPGTPSALIARFDQMEARLSELAVALNRIDELSIRGRESRVDERQLSTNGPDGRDKRENDQVSKSAANVGKLEEIKGRMLDSLQDPATNITTLMNSHEMRSLSAKQQDEVMQEVSARLDSGQLSKEQFLPGYKSRTGTK